jgi:hypothetical protein
MQRGRIIRIIAKTKFLNLYLRKKMAGSNAAKKSQGLKATAKMIKHVPKKNIALSLVFSN